MDDGTDAITAALQSVLDAVFSPATMSGDVMATKNSDGCTAACFLVAEDPDKPATWHLQVKDPDGTPNHTLMGAAWAALHEGYRGNKYSGPNADEALTRLTALYKSEKMPLPDATMSAAGEPDATTVFADSGALAETPIGATDDTVIRPGKIFEVGSYPSQGFTFTSDDLAAAVANFTPVPIKLGHDVLLAKQQRMPAALEGKMGTLARIWQGDDGRSLMGEVHLPKWLDALLDAGSRKVSTEWHRTPKRLTGLALVQTPQVSDAVLMAAFADAEKSPGMRSDTGQYARHDTPAGQATMQAGHDLMVARGAVCQTAAMASTHEMNATQAAHDLFVAHGAQCAPVTNSATPTPKRRARMNLREFLTGQAQEKGVELDPAEVEAAFSTEPSAEVADLKRQLAEQKAKQDEQDATFARMATEKRHAEAVTFASTQVAAHRVVPAAAEKLAALAERIAAADSVATFAEGESPTLTLLAEFIAAQPDFTVFTTEGITNDVAALFNRATTDDSNKPREETTNAMLQATPTGRAILAARANGKN